MIKAPFLIAGVLLLLPAAVAAQQEHPEAVRGKVVSDDGPLRGADIIVIRAPDRETRRTQTDSLGNFRIVFPHGTGDYLVHIQAFGWQPVRQRVTRSAPGDTVLTLNVSLKPVALELDPLKVKAARDKPGPGSDPFGPKAGTSEQIVMGVNSALTPADAGNLAAMAATIPGVIANGGGISVLGLGPAQNNVTLNGMAFGGGSLPREARTWTRVATAAYDPARGGFSGAQTAVDLSPGGFFASARGHITADAPALQATDEISRQLGMRQTSAKLSTGLDGQLVADRFFYSTALDIARTTSPAPTLLNASDAVLQLSGVAADSVARLVTALGAVGLPGRFGELPNRTNDHVSFVGRIDHTPFQQQTTWGVLAYADVTRDQALSLSPTATPTYGGARSSGAAVMLANFSSYFHSYFLNETKSAFTYRWNHGTPYLRVPAGRVLVTSLLPDTTLGLASLNFGGNGSLDTNPTDWTWETTSELQWYNRNSHHRLHFYGNARLDGYARSATSNPYGTFNYNSLADLSANRPASFTRTLNVPAVQGREMSGALAASDTWRPSSVLQLLYGARVEANHYATPPAANPAILATFGARTNNAPQTLHISPRLGFTWIYGGLKQANNYGFSVSPIASRALSPKGMIRGGIGEFRNFLRPDLLSDAQMATGLPGSTSQLLCVGNAAPLPNWQDYLADPASIPTTCADASAVFADAAPSVRLFAHDYNAERAWRANLSLSSQKGKLLYSIEGVYSLNLDQPGVFDLNFAGLPRFTLIDEGRSVFVSPASIVAATGTVSPVEARTSSAFANVLERRSDLRSTSRRVTMTLMPDVFGRMFVSVAYSLAQSRARTRGFDGSAFGDPRIVEWAPSSLDVRHQVQLQAGFYVPHLSFSLYSVIASGRPFTPLIAGDVNGDGFSNDRAFVFDPARASNSVATGMSALLASAPERVRACLRTQLGSPARTNSCRAPWTQQLNAQLQLSPRWSPTAVGLLRRSSLTLNLANPLGAIDQLLHGSNNLHGWGLQPLPDPVLYRVRGFDPQAQRFVYEVNPRFGDTRPSRTALRMPFRVTLDLKIDLGRPLGRQQIDRWVRPGRAGHKGARLSADSLAKLYGRNMPDMYGTVLEQSDSLLLSALQIDSIKAENKRYTARMDSLWQDLARYLAALPDVFDENAVVARQERTVDESWSIAWNSAQRLKAYLSPVQVRMLPWPAKMLAEAKKPPVGIRIYRY